MDVSIIMPAYNMEGYIQQAILSVINQTYKNWELLIIDDGSTDNTRRLIEEFLPLDSRISYFFHKNSGVAFTRNRGIELAKGKYISFLDSDDCYEPTYIEKMVAPLKQGAADISFCKFKEVHEEKILSKTPENLNKLYGNSFYAHITKYPHSRANMATMYTLEHLRTHEIYFSEGSIFAEDTEFVLKASIGANIEFIPEYLYIYNYREDSASRGEFTSERYLSAIDAYSRVLLFAEKKYSRTKYSDFFTYINQLIFNTKNEAKRFLWDLIKKGEYSHVIFFLTEYKKRYQKEFSVPFSGIKKITNWPKIAAMNSQNKIIYAILYFTSKIFSRS